MAGTVKTLGFPEPRRALAPLLIIATCLAATESEAAYAKRKAITIDRTLVGNAGAPVTLTDHPFLFSVDDPDLRTVANGGDVTDPEGDDIVFSSCGDPSTCRLDHELERYDGTAGAVRAWVRLPSVNTRSASTDTVLYVHYSDSTVTSSQQSPALVWDAAHRAVWHLSDDPSVSKDCNGAPGTKEICDSTAGSADGDSGGGLSSTDRVPGRVASALRLSSASSQNVDFGDLSSVNSVQALTVTGWFNPASLPPNQTALGKFHSGAVTGWRLATGGSGPGVVAHDATSTATGTGLSLTVPHTTSGADRLMLVGVSQVVESTGVVVTSITYGGIALSEVCQVVGGLTDTRVHIWALVAPPVGTADVVVTLGGGPSGYAKAIGASTFTGVDQVTPYGACVTAQGGSVIVGSAPGELVYDAAVSKDSAITVGPGQTQRWSRTVTGTAGQVYGGGSTEPGAATVTMSWGGSFEGAIAALPIRAAPVGVPDGVRLQFDGAYGETAGGLLANGAWGHWGMVFDGSQATNSTRLRFYLNGVQQALSFTGLIPAMTPSTAHALRLGGTADALDFFDGTADEVRISSIARSDHWILTEHNNASSPSTFATLGPEEDRLAVEFAGAASSGPENATPANLAVSLSAPSGLQVRVGYAVTGGTAAAGGTDYALAAGTLTFAPGATSLPIPLTVVDDALDEANETVVISLSAPSNAVVGPRAIHTFTIADDDLPPAVSFAAAESSVTESTVTSRLPVVLSSPSGQTVTVGYAVSGGTAAGGADYALATGTLTFAPGQASLEVALDVLDDAAEEPVETVVVTLSQPSLASIGSIPSHTVTIADNDARSPVVTSQPGLSARCGVAYAYSASGRVHAEGTPPLRFAVQMGPAGLAIDPDTGTLTWTPTSQQAGSQQVVVTVANAAGTARHEFVVDVGCSSVTGDVGCNCSTAGSGQALLLVGLAAMVVVASRRRRRVRREWPPSP